VPWWVPPRWKMPVAGCWYHGAGAEGAGSIAAMVSSIRYVGITIQSMKIGKLYNARMLSLGTSAASLGALKMRETDNSRRSVTGSSANAIQ